MEQGNKMKHKHCDLIKAWADGAEIQYYDTYTNNGTWRDVAGRDLNWHRELVYRIKPKNEFLKFRNALLTIGKSFHIEAQYPDEYESIQKKFYFVRWIGEEQTVEIEE